MNSRAYIWVCRWDAYERVGFFSERVEIVFRAVYDTSNDIAVRAAAVQNRNIIHHIAERVSHGSINSSNDGHRSRSS